MTYGDNKMSEYLIPISIEPLKEAMKSGTTPQPTEEPSFLIIQVKIFQRAHYVR